MLHTNTPIRDIEAIACSGGLDSMAILSFLLRGRHKVKVAYFNHGTEHGAEAETFVRKYCKDNNLDIIVGHIQSEKPKGMSPEMHWRDERYAFLDSLGLNIATAHHLNDAAETYLMSFCTGQAKLIPTRRGMVCRPFLLTERSELARWVEAGQVPYIEDPSNTDLKYKRNLVRHTILPQILQLNPGFLNVVRRLYLSGAQEHDQYSNRNCGANAIYDRRDLHIQPSV